MSADSIDVHVRTGDGGPGPAFLPAVRAAHATAAEAVVLGASVATWRRRTRADLGFADPDATVIATGHQPGLWHPGILAKYAALRAIEAADGTDASPPIRTVDLLVDQDDVAPLRVEIPFLEDGERVRTRVLDGAGPLAEGVAGRRAPVRVAFGDAAAAVVPGTAERMAACAAALDAARTAPSLAVQIRRAVADLVPAACRPPTFVTATELLRTRFGRAVVAEMVRDPWRCAVAYARALRATNLDIPFLHVRDDFVELPLWRLDATRRRRADDVDAAAWLDGDDTIDLAPRALLLTLLARVGLADGFVHGLGGGRYDAAMEAWADAWLGVAVAPMLVVSADVRLERDLLPAGLPVAARPPGSVPRAASPSEAASAVARAHRIWHDPEPPVEQGGSGPGPVKSELLAGVRRLPRRSTERRRAFRAMHRQLVQLRGVHVGRVEAAQRASRRAQIADANEAVLRRRDWPFVVYPPAQLEAMAARVAHATMRPTAPDAGTP